MGCIYMFLPSYYFCTIPGNTVLPEVHTRSAISLNVFLFLHTKLFRHRDLDPGGDWMSLLYPRSLIWTSSHLVRKSIHSWALSWIKCIWHIKRHWKSYRWYFEILRYKRYIAQAYDWHTHIQRCLISLRIFFICWEAVVMTAQWKPITPGEMISLLALEDWEDWVWSLTSGWGWQPVIEREASQWKWKLFLSPSVCVCVCVCERVGATWRSPIKERMFAPQELA